MEEERVEQEQTHLLHSLFLSLPARCALPQVAWYGIARAGRTSFFSADDAIIPADAASGRLTSACT